MKKNGHTKAKAATKANVTRAREGRASVEQRLQTLESRLTIVEQALRWQPNQPPGFEPAPLSQH